MKELYPSKSGISGKGLFTREPIKKHELVDYIHGPTKVIRHFTRELSKKTLNWIGVGRYTWIDTDESPFRFINHSCEPNVAIVTKRKVIALKHIDANTELTMDYSLTEADEEWSIEKCTCGSAHCRGRITSIQKLPKRVVERYRDHMPENFVKLYEVELKRR